MSNFKQYIELQLYVNVEVPKYVADWYEFHMDGTFSAVISAYSFNVGESRAVDWISQNGGIDLLCRIKLYGYRIEKPQLFYLKHIDMSKSEKYDYYLRKLSSKELAHVVVLKNDPPTEYPNKREYFQFTQAEINEMNTGSYEQIGVPNEG